MRRALESADLTARQWEVVELVGRGMSYKRAASAMGVEYDTIRVYATRIRDRVGLDMDPFRVLVHLWHHRDQAA